jgi:hypothetical protein
MDFEPLAKFYKDCKKCQGTTLVVPKDYQKMLGFSPCVCLFPVICSSAAAKAGKSEWAICGTTEVVP